MIKTTLKRRIGAILLSGALILGGAFAPSTAYADNGEEIVNSEITVSENEDISDEIADLSGGENVTTEEDTETVDTEETNDGTDEESNVETVETTEDQSVDTETAQEDDEVDESDNTALDEGWEEVDESDLPPDDTVLDTIELQIEEVEELSESFDESTVLESKTVIPENVLNSNAATKSTDTVEGDLVDLTDIYTGEVATHDCQNYLKVCHDGEHHWHECAVCGEKFDIKDHNFTTMGSDSCAWYNSGQTKYCEDCG